MNIRRNSLKILDFFSENSLSFVSKVVFGEPINDKEITIVPVTKIKYGFGFGQGKKDSSNEGQGGGGGVAAEPVGYIEVYRDKTRFRRIKKHNLLKLIAVLTFSGYVLFQLKEKIKKN